MAKKRQSRFSEDLEGKVAGEVPQVEDKREENAHRVEITVKTGTMLASTITEETKLEELSSSAPPMTFKRIMVLISLSLGFISAGVPIFFITAALCITLRPAAKVDCASLHHSRFRW